MSQPLQVLAALLFVAACGGDDEGGATPKAAGAPGAPVAAGSGSNVAALVPMPHVEDRVTCPVPKKTEDLPAAEDRCDPQAVIPCKDKAKPYCLTVPIAQNAAYCFQCLERDNIRHAFKDRDFASEQNRDPFQSFVLSPVGVGSGSGSGAVADVNTAVKCKETNSYMPSYSYLDLHLVGIVTQGTLRKGLITGGRTNAIIRRNDCVGKEKALVKEVGDGFTTFITQPDPAVAGSRAVEYTLLLRPNNTLALGSPELPPDSTTPSNVPSPNVPSPNQKTQPQQGTTTRVEIPSPKQPPPQQIPSPQLNLNP